MHLIPHNFSFASTFPVSFEQQDNGPSSAVQLGEELQFWTERDGSTPHFKAMGAMHSELMAISTTGQLCQWRWSDAEPYVAMSSKDVQVKRDVLFAI